MNAAYVGLDIGTSGCKAAAFDDQGCLRGLAAAEYDLHLGADGAAELDPATVLARCRETVRAVATTADMPPIRGLGITCQGEAFTALDAEGRPLCRAMVSSDTRATEFVASGVPGLSPERLYRLTGHTPHPMFTLYKLMWLRTRAPDIWRRAARLLCFEDLVQYRLGIEPAMGWPLAGRTMLFDVTRHAWSPEILAAVGVRPEQLARPLASGSVAGVIPPEIAADWGLPPGVKVVTGGHDQPCGALGAGVTMPGVAMYATGTVECITPAFAAPVFTPELMRANLCTYDHAAPGMYATVAFSLTGGNALKWFRDEFGQPEIQAAAAAGDDDVYGRLLALAGDAPSPLLCLPYLTPSGTPYFDTQTPGILYGLRLGTRRGEILCALLEGVAFEMRLNVATLEAAGAPVRELRAIGGGAKSSLWNQLKADVLGKPITSLDVSEAGCRGVALLACAADQNRPIAGLATQWVHSRAVFEPRPDRAAHYTERFRAYQALYAAAQRMPAR
ncbi:MAG: hypothetical protein K9N49_07785 [Candidatus Marinimicrobia bacterium]|nr:hypothetical protein [Candidatus Neomarinimicrobiota bacterium]